MDEYSENILDLVKELVGMLEAVGPEQLGNIGGATIISEVEGCLKKIAAKNPPTEVSWRVDKVKGLIGSLESRLFEEEKKEFRAALKVALSELEDN
jgi:hypothetical protein